MLDGKSIGLIGYRLAAVCGFANSTDAKHSKQDGFREGRLCKGTQEQCVRNLLMWIQLCKGINVMSLTCLRAFGSEARYFRQGSMVKGLLLGSKLRYLPRSCDSSLISLSAL